MVFYIEIGTWCIRFHVMTPDVLESMCGKWVSSFPLCSRELGTQSKPVYRRLSVTANVEIVERGEQENVIHQKE